MTTMQTETAPRPRRERRPTIEPTPASEEGEPEIAQGEPEDAGSDSRDACELGRDAQIFVTYESAKHLIETIPGSAYQDGIALVEMIDKKLRSLALAARQTGQRAPRRIDAYMKMRDTFETPRHLAYVRIDSEKRYHRRYNRGGHMVSHGCSSERLAEIVTELVGAHFTKTRESLSRGTILSELRQRSIYLRKGGPELDRIGSIQAWQPSPSAPRAYFPTKDLAGYAAAAATVQEAPQDHSFLKIARASGIPADTVRQILAQIRR